jgi:hypothetical protein
VGLQSGGVDWDSSAPSTARFAGCSASFRLDPPFCVRTTPRPTPLPGVHTTTEGHLGVCLLI